MTEPVDAPRADGLPTAGVADLRSDTINPDGVSAGEPVVEAGTAEVDVEALKREQVEMRRIQAGLDRAVAKVTTQRDTNAKRVEQLEAQLAIYSTADGANNDVITDYMQQLEVAAAERDQWQQQAEKAILSESRVRIVASEFPGLTPLIDAQALPQAEDDESFRASLATLQDTFQSAAEARHTQHVQGIKPPAAPPAQPAPDTDVLKKQMLTAEPGSETFNRARDQWYAALGITEK